MEDVYLSTETEAEESRRGWLKGVRGRVELSEAETFGDGPHPRPHSRRL